MDHTHHFNNNNQNYLFFFFLLTSYISHVVVGEPADELLIRAQISTRHNFDKARLIVALEDTIVAGRIKFELV